MRGVRGALLRLAIVVSITLVVALLADPATAGCRPYCTSDLSVM